MNSSTTKGKGRGEDPWIVTFFISWIICQPPKGEVGRKKGKKGMLERRPEIYFL